MITSNSSNSNLFKPGPSGEVSPADAARMKEMDDMKSQALDEALWASAQGLALSKLKVFHAMAKQVNEQQ